MLRLLCLLAVLFGCSALTAEANGQSQDAVRLTFQQFLKQQGLALRDQDVPPATAAEWQQRKQQLRENLLRAWGGLSEADCPLDPMVHGQLDFPDYRVERITFQTLPDVRMTANAYVPKSGAAGAGTKLPAVLCVHGHWSGAKQDPVVQSRCIGLAKLGFFVLSVDAFGAGERGTGKKLGEYHGEMTGALLLPVGRPLSGIQVLENMRAVDYLQSRPEVDPQRIGITGASGGGNQTMYAGAFDERLQCIVPVCSVGNYQAYLSAACCMCEVVPAALTFTEEGDVLGLMAGRGLMVISATQDAFQFSVDQARISVGRASRIAEVLGQPAVQHTIIESPHHYNQPMREAMYGWMTRHLKQQGDGQPISEPLIEPVDRELLRCFPEESRPDDFMTIPRFAAAEARKILQQRARTSDRDFLQSMTTESSADTASALRDQQVRRLAEVLRVHPQPAELRPLIRIEPDQKRLRLEMESEPGLTLTALCDVAGGTSRGLVIVVDADAGAEAAFRGEVATRLRMAGWRIVVPELRATGATAAAQDRIGQAPDHNSAEWSMWVGRPLPGQWVLDIRTTLDALKHADETSESMTCAVVGIGSAGIAALSAAALDERFSRAAAVESLSSWVSDVPYRGHRLGLMVPGILRESGDVGHIAALIAPRPVLIAGAVDGGGQRLDEQQLAQTYDWTKRVYAACGQPEALRLTSSADVTGF